MAFPKTRGEMIAQGYQHQSNTICRGCSARMEYWNTPKSARIPMDPMPSDDAPATSHFATCPKAQQFRRK